MRFSPRMAFSAFVHLLHCAAIFVLLLFVPGTAGTLLRSVWAVALFFSVLTFLVLLRVGSYRGTTEEEVGALIRRGYWTATGLYLALLAAALYFLFWGSRFTP